MSIQDIFAVAGKKALVTGGASGIGLAVAEALAENGAAVAIVDRDKEALDREAARLAGRDLQVSGFEADVTGDAIGETVGRAITALDGLDIVFANAGITGGYGPRAAGNDAGLFENIDIDRWNRTVAVNLNGVVNTLKAAIPPLKQQRSGKIIVTASIAGLRANPAIGYCYTASKSALVLVLKELALELAPFGIQVNGLAPGPFKTNINDGRFFDPENEAREAKNVPLGRIARPHEIKGLALLLSSDASSYITGSVIPIDGGLTAGA